MLHSLGQSLPLLYSEDERCLSAHSFGVIYPGFCALLSLATLLSPLNSAAAEAPETPLVEPGVVLVTFPPESTGGKLRTQSVGSYMLSTAGLRTLSSLSNTTFRIRITGKVMRQASSASARPAAITNELEICRELQKSGAITGCSPNWVVQAGPITSATPDDPKYTQQYAHAHIDSARAWDRITDSQSVVVGVIDTGVDYNHPDLRDNIWTNPGEIPGNGIDDDGNGYTDDVHGWDSSQGPNGQAGDGDPMDGNGHGTHCAGIIGARGNNSLGVVGLNWRTKIMPIKFLTDAGWGYLSDAIKAIDYAVLMKQRGVNVRVLSNSWGGGGYSPALEAAVERARGAGIVFVAAAGNSASNNDDGYFSPASITSDNVVSVAASDDIDALAYFSSFGQNSVHLAAPGDRILSTWLNADYQVLSGTSMATPYVSGALALLLAYQPELTYREAVTRLLSTGKPLASLDGLTISGRLLNVGNLVENITPSPITDPSVCNYTAQLIPFSTPADLSQDPPILPKFSSGWAPINHTAELPFEFPFYSQKYSSLSVGMNGVIYLDREQAPWVVSRYPFPPRFAIAAFHSRFFDWVVPAGVGAWMRSSPQRVDIQWRVAYLWRPSSDRLTITVSLFPDGTIQQFTSVNDRLARVLQTNFITGIRGNTVANSLTVSQNGFPVVFRGDMGLQYTRPQSCVIPPTPPQATPMPRREEVRSLRLDDHRGARNRVSRGKSFTLHITASMALNVQLRIALGGRECAAAVSLPMSESSESTQGIWPAIGEQFKSVTFRADDSGATASVHGKAPRRASNNFGRACSAVAKAIREAR